MTGRTDGTGEPGRRTAGRAAQAHRMTGRAASQDSP